MSKHDASLTEDEKWMQLALQQAGNALACDEVPVGAVLIEQDSVIGLGWNQCISGNDPTAHAEIVALRAAAAQKQNYRLPNSTLYVTLEPCAMCLGALVHARVGRLVFGAREPKGGCVVSNAELLESGHFNHRFDWTEGTRADECGALLSNFFAARR